MEVKWNCDFCLCRIEFQAVRGSSELGYIAIDELDFLQTGSCEFKPKEAQPITTTTPQPTEPPGRKFCYLIL